MTKKTTMIFGAAMMIALGAGCGELTDQPDFQSMRGGGKADGWVDPTLSCSGSCGSLATSFTGYCGCDDLCAAYGDCCNDKAQVCDGAGPDQATCEAIDKDYQTAVDTAGSCSTDADCQKFVGGTLICGHPTRAIDSTLEGPVNAARQKYNDNQCFQFPWNCPMFTPLPPWFETHGVCEQGTCQVKYVDTRAAKEGDACGDDIGVACGDGLYCAFGLNWCGTPPVTGICRKHGDCGAPSDCLNQANPWIHPMCMGEATCDNNSKCGWDCGTNPF